MALDSGMEDGITGIPKKDKKVFIGIDNGTSGSIGILCNGNVEFVHTPIKKELSYTKKKQWINRIDGNELYKILSQYTRITMEPFVYLERPMVNPGRFKATISAVRALEATLIIIEKIGLPYAYIDSKEWQSAMLPKGLQKEELKKASLQIGQRLFPQISFKGFTDADGLLIAAWAKNKKNE